MNFMQSQAGTLNSTDIQNWAKNLLVFLAPVIILYLTSVLAVVQFPGHVVKLVDFIPNSVTVGGIVVYLLNGIIDLFKKLIQGY